MEYITVLGQYIISMMYLFKTIAGHSHPPAHQTPTI